MSQDIFKKVIDITGIELVPGEPAVCLGNGEQGFECCCDECDYYLLCFPEFDPKPKELTKQKSHTPYYDKRNTKALLTLDINLPVAYLPGGKKASLV